MLRPKRMAVLVAMSLLVGIAVIAAWPSVSDFLAQDDCLDAGGAWRNSVCEGRRPGE